MASATAKLQKLVEQFTPLIRDAFFAAIEDLTDRAIIAELVAAIEAGDINRAIASLGLDERAFRSLSAAIEQAFETGGVVTGSTFPKTIQTPIARTVFRFDVRNSRAEAWLRDYSSQKVVEITEETRAVARAVIQRGMVDGRNPRSTALDLVGRVDTQTGKRVGGSIGLTRQQETWVSNARRDLQDLNDLLDAGYTKDKLSEKIDANNYFQRARRMPSGDDVIKRALLSGERIDDATVEKLLTHYKRSMLQYRGETIGRTESISALNQAEQEAIVQAVEQGAVNEKAVKRVWDAAGDKRTRTSHGLMDGQTVGLREPFTFPDGTKAMFPGDRSLDAPAGELINCRCIARTVVDWLHGARDVVTEDERAAIAALTDDELFGGR